jgi:hypothetical protein
MNIKSAQYLENEFKAGTNISIKAIIDDVEMSVPLDPANRHYAEILKQVDAGTLTIAAAD